MCVSTGTWAPTGTGSECRSPFAEAFQCRQHPGWGHLALLHKVLLSPSLHLLLVPFSGCCAVQPIRAQGQSQAWSCWGRAVLLQTCLRSIMCIVVSFNCINHPPYHAPVLLHRIDRAALLPWYSPLGEWQSSLLSPCIVSLFVQFSTNATLTTSHSNSIVRQNYPPPYHFSAYEYFLKNNDFLLPNVLWNEETSSLQIKAWGTEILMSTGLSHFESL